MYGAAESELNDATQRPGGIIRVVLVFTVNSQRRTSDRYRLIGDKYSVDAVRRALRAECSAASDSDTGFSYNSTLDDTFHTLPHIQSVVQFYRAGTFALSLDGYNNSAGTSELATTNNTGQHSATTIHLPAPLPSDIDRSFLRCINGTVGSSLPLFSPGSHELTTTNDASPKHRLWLGPFTLVTMALLILLLNWLFPSTKDITDPWLERLGHLAAIAALLG